MKRSESISALAAAMAKVQSDVSAASKDSVNPHLKNRYADLASVWDACRAALTKHQVAVIQCPAYADQRAGVVTLLVHASGEWVEDDLMLPVARQDPQGVGSAITYARRYALASMVGVVADDDDDGNKASGRDGSKEAAHAVAEQKLSAMKAQRRPPPEVIDFAQAPPEKPSAIKPSTGVSGARQLQIDTFRKMGKFERLNELKRMKAHVGGEEPYRAVLAIFGAAKSTELEGRPEHVQFYEALVEVHHRLTNVAALLKELDEQTGADIMREMVGESKVWAIDADLSRKVYRALANALKSQKSAQEAPNEEEATK